MPAYSIARRTAAPQANAGWDSVFWADVMPLSVSRFHRASTRNHPVVEAKVAHSSDAVHVLFRVTERFVLCEKTELHSFVCKDSCVEAFLEPVAGKGYFNFEMNCGGTLLLFYVHDANDLSTDKGRTKITEAEVKTIRIVPSLQEKKPFSLTGPVTWTLQCSIPVALMEKYVGELGALEGQHWRGNFFKCADSAKYPHWASWASVGAPLRFHQPKRYGELYFKKLLG